MLTAVAGRLTGSAALFDANWNAGLPGNLAIGARGRGPPVQHISGSAMACLAPPGEPSETQGWRWLTPSARAPFACAGRRPAFSVNTVTVLGRQSLAELAAEAAQVAAAAAGAAAAGGYAGAQGAPSPATVAKSLLALTVLASGAPVVPQDAVADLADAHFVGVLMRQRRRLAHLLLPPRFDSPRDIRWHGADAAAEPIWDAGGRLRTLPAVPAVHWFHGALLPTSRSRHGTPGQAAAGGRVRAAAAMTIAVPFARRTPTDLAADAAAAGRADVNYLAFSGGWVGGCGLLAAQVAECWHGWAGSHCWGIRAGVAAVAWMNIQRMAHGCAGCASH
jgi:hypothetical protein